MGTREQEKIWEYFREIGKPTLLRHETPEVQWALAKIRSYNTRGMSLSAMADQVGIAQDAVTRLFRDERPGLRRGTFEKIRKIQFDGEGGLRAQVPFLGAQRRLRALRADGFPYEVLCREMGHPGTSPRLQRIITGWRGKGKPVGFIIAFTARGIEAMYEKLAGTDPRDIGVSDFAMKYSVRRAARLGYAPSSCWDLDTIDDPEAIPEWTGRCGTVFGWHIHQTDNIPVCPPCAAARETGSVEFSGTRFREFRDKSGLSRNQLAARIGVNASTIQYWETGRSTPTRQNKLDLALRILDVTLEEVCE